MNKKDNKDLAFVEIHIKNAEDCIIKVRADSNVVDIQEHQKEAKEAANSYDLLLDAVRSA